jgi:hypothetical protein
MARVLSRDGSKSVFDIRDARAARAWLPPECRSRLDRQRMLAKRFFDSDIRKKTG